MDQNPHANQSIMNLLIEVKTVADRTAQSVENMDKRLFGNGQPGELSILRDDVAELKADRSKVNGAMWVLRALVAAVGIPEIIHVLSKK